MKPLNYFIFLVFLLTACSEASQASIDPPAPAVYASPTPQAGGVSTDDSILVNIRYSLSISPHAAECSCEDCHTSSETIGKELSWFNKVTGQTESISTPTELCEKCHPDQVMESDAQLVHTNFGCPDCHNAHSTQASCTQSGCHTNIQNTISAHIERPEPHPTSGDPSFSMCGGSSCHELAKQVANSPVYHQPVHSQVPCHVCHDASGMMVLGEDNQAWTTLNESEQPVISHSIGRVAECTKCHSYNNPWGIVEILPNN